MAGITNIVFKTNVDKLTRQIATVLQSRIRNEVEAGMTQGMRLFESFVIRNMLSGRRSEDLGLNRGEGNASSSGVIVKEGIGTDQFRVRLGWKAFYLIAHQEGMTIYGNPVLVFRVGDGTLVFATHVTIPKRIYIPETFIQQGRQMIDQKVKERMKALRRLRVR